MRGEQLQFEITDELTPNPTTKVLVYRDGKLVDERPLSPILGMQPLIPPVGLKAGDVIRVNLVGQAGKAVTIDKDCEVATVKMLPSPNQEIADTMVAYLRKAWKR